MAWTWKKTALMAAGTVGGAALIALTGGLAAPAIGAAIGSGLGLSGAAATSAGLAALGGGALAAGGGGMAAGTSLIIGAGAAAGAAAGGVAAAGAASSLSDVRKCKTCNGLLDEKAKFCPQCGKKV